jgi:hypothetical protein
VAAGEEEDGCCEQQPEESESHRLLSMRVDESAPREAPVRVSHSGPRANTRSPPSVRIQT